MAYGIPQTISEPVHELSKERPLLRAAIYRCYRSYMRAVLRGRRARSLIVHDVPIDPFEIFWIDPETITHKMWGGTSFEKDATGTVVGGDWDLDPEPFDEYDVYLMAKKHFEEGVPWEETEKYREFVRRVESGEACWHGCTSVSDVDARCRSLDDLYEHVSRVGIVHPRAVGERTADPLPNESVRRYPTNLRTISVNLSRDGAPIVDDGRHRVTIAKLCDVDRIPVTVTVRHRLWQRRRERYAATGSGGEHFDVPSAEPPRLETPKP